MTNEEKVTQLVELVEVLTYLKYTRAMYNIAISSSVVEDDIENHIQILKLQLSELSEE